MKGQVGPGEQNWLLTNLRRSLYRSGWFRSIFGLIIALELLYVFESLFLAMLAFAMLVYMPIPQVTPRLQNPNFYISSVVMLALLFMAFSNSAFLGLGLEFTGSWYAPWTWNTTMILFVGFWLISFIACLSGNSESRQGMGAFMIVFASVIFAVGVGGQEMGTAFFGPWWPTVHNFGSQVLTPLGDAISGITSTLGQGWMLLTNPVGYATQLMNGTHAENPLGESGALGVEITDLTVSQIFVNQPFLITATVYNKGAFDAEDVEVRLSVDDFTAPKKKMGFPRGEWAYKMTVEALGLDTGSGEDKCKLSNSKNYCFINVVSGDSKFAKQNMQQVSFSSQDGINCDVIKAYELSSYAIPLKAEVSYTYEVDSRLDVEFISDAEWNRLTHINIPYLKDVQSEYSTAPVKFPLGTAGLKQPIKADQPFHIGLMLDADQKNGRIEGIEEIKLNVPADFGDAECNPNPDSAGRQTGSDTNTLVWIKGKSLGDEKSRIIYCSFKPLKEKVTGPTKTYLVTAHAKYRFNSWKTKSTRLQFGGYCCSDDNCASGQKCCVYTDGGGGYCIPEGETCGEGTGQLVPGG